MTTVGGLGPGIPVDWSPLAPQLQKIADWFGVQTYPSPLSAAVMRDAANSVSSGGIWAEVLNKLGTPTQGPDGWWGVTYTDAGGQTVRLPGPRFGVRAIYALNHLVFNGKADALIPYWPIAGESFDSAKFDASNLSRTAIMFNQVRAAIRTNMDEFCERLFVPPQSIAVGRSAALLPGLLAVAEITGNASLALIELGSRGHQHLRLDGYAYIYSGQQWGNSSAPLVFDTYLPGSDINFSGKLNIVARIGVDSAPLDLTDPRDQHRAFACTPWPDNQTMFNEFWGACAAASLIPVQSIQGDPVALLSQLVQHRTPGATTVIQHTVFSTYLPKATQEEIAQTMNEALSLAAPGELAYLTLEPDYTGSARWPVKLTVSGYGTYLVAESGPEGNDVLVYGLTRPEST